MLERKEYLKTVRRPYPPFFASLILTGYADHKNFKDFLRKPFTYKNLVKVDHFFYYNKFENKRVEKLVMDSWKDQLFFSRVEKEFKKREDNLIMAATKSFKDFCKAYQEYMPSVLLIFLADKPTEKALRTVLLKKLSEDEVEDLMNKLNIPFKDNFYKQEEYDLVTARDLKKHVERYKWLVARYGDEKEYTFKDAKAKLESMEKEQFLRKWEKDKKELKRIILKTKLILQKDAWLVDLFQYIIYYRTHRTDIMNKSAFLAIPMLKKKARSLKLTYRELLHASVEEILENRIPEREVLESRMKDCSILLKDGKLTLLEGEKSREVREFFKEDLAKVKEIKGQIASKGKIKGRVKLIFGSKDFYKINKGEVLVTSMTVPNMVPIMKKAAAFVTDEGGVTCHAAIISREMGKPCIIGTQIATQILKDNDLIEVDADRGIIRIL
jgi:phosphohistidine swiveling domain-containing protein